MLRRIHRFAAGTVFIRRIFLAALIFATGSTFAIGASLDLPGKTAEEGTQLVKRSLKRLNTDCVEQDITLGSQWRCKTPLFSIVSLDIFVSTIPEKTIIRADSRNRQSYAFIDLVSNENGEKPYETKYSEKSLLLSAGATLVSPALGYWYANSNSMIKNKSIFLPILGFLAGDLALFWMSSKIYFTNGFDPFDVGLKSMLISMGTYRAI
ncbi:MAG TPA: hypothetical protein PKY99_15095, partial [Turneriella sp.]|nr:hypothetical protein [Turneriella sp.]